MRSKLHYLATFVLVSIACVNIWAFNQYVSRFPPKEADERVIWEQRLAAIQSVLISAGYRNGDVGYLPAGALKGQTTAREEVDWVHVRYTMIPLNVLCLQCSLQVWASVSSSQSVGFLRSFLK